MTGLNCHKNIINMPKLYLTEAIYTTWRLSNYTFVVILKPGKRF